MSTGADVDRMVSKVVRALAVMRDETVEQAAEAAGIGRDTMYRRLRGQGEWKVRELRALADHFAVPVSLFIDGPDGPLGVRGQMSAHMTSDLSDFRRLLVAV